MNAPFTKTLFLCVILANAISVCAQSVVGHTNFGERQWVMVYQKVDGSTESFSGNNTFFAQTLGTFIDFEVPLNEEEDGIRDGKERHFWFWKHRPLSSYRIPLMKVDSITESCNSLDYQTVFLEEFSGTELDTTLWYPNFALDTFGSQDFPCWYLPSQVKVEDDKLKLGLKYLEDGETRQFTRDGVTYSDTRNHHAGTIVSRTLPNTGPNPVGGCWQFGRYTFRAKLSEPKTAAAIWFFGWPGEADLIEVRAENNFKRLVHGYHAWSVVDDCDRDVTQRQLKLTRTQDRLCPDLQIADWHLLINKSSDNPPDLYSKFHEFSYEWTPFKQLFKVNGVVTLEVFRYYETRFVRGNNFFPDIIHLRGLDCDEIPKNTLLPKVWENLAWNRMSRFGMDMIISQGAEKGAATPDKDFVIDWIRVEQRRGENWGLQANTEASTVCLADTMSFTLKKGDLENSMTWTVSDNLKVLHSTDHSIIIQAMTAGKGYVEATFNNPLSCHNIVQRQELQAGPPVIDSVQATYVKCQGYQLFADLADYQGTPRWEVRRPGKIAEIYDDTTTVFIPMELGDSVAYTLHLTNDCGSDSFNGELIIREDDCDGFELQVYPNPATTAVNYILGRSFRQQQLNENEEFTLLLVDARSVVIRETTRQKGAGSINIAELKPGIYYLVIKSDGRFIAAKAVVKH